MVLHSISLQSFFPISHFNGLPYSFSKREVANRWEGPPHANDGSDAAIQSLGSVLGKTIVPFPFDGYGGAVSSPPPSLNSVLGLAHAIPSFLL